ncbi:DUF6414 family protein [Clostridium thermopalmarium]|uniref:Uncharacterized protein n=1 Tax=Clostridium thermopalmarium DSM 5974 TaxID=1121340 RepID=A0A2T0AXP8_9CLOT|nr:hypothetical protein [Clostridium thermopalmarium]MBE6043480.1 hypothetical protein [Clostridium thermopalmarium]PRR75666.1 hypothetical protein CPAL_04970 [Clostridium thermopalmarium DSM 5974]PVZ26646.1 hypothetical protein LX19_00724 [Clostridium thermopalmarium DSM 5974]
MVDNRAIIPLYANENLLNNLFTVVVQQFAQIRTVSIRNQQTLRITTPLANVVKGSYIQGTCDIELINEFANQRTEERVSKIIVVFLETRGILEKNNLLKRLDSSDDINKLQENDYVEFKCILNKSPQIKQMEDIIRYMEMEHTFCPNNTSINSEILSRMKNSLEAWKNSNSLKFITEGLAGTNTRAIVPLQLKYMHDSLDDIYNNYVTVMGKVVKGKDRVNKNVDLSSHTYYDFLDDIHFKEFKEKFLKNAPIDGMYRNEFVNNSDSFIEVLPIAMYI